MFLYMFLLEVRNTESVHTAGPILHLEWLTEKAGSLQSELTAETRQLSPHAYLP